MTAASAVAPRKTDATGRSAKVVSLGRAKRWKVEGSFVPHTRTLLDSPAWAALNWPARRILDHLEVEHMMHGGAENGRLLAPHKQLRAKGISGRKIKPALDLLEALGLIRCTSDGYRHGGRPRAATYALTWLPTADGEPPTEGFRGLSRANVTAIVAELNGRGTGDE